MSDQRYEQLQFKFMEETPEPVPPRLKGEQRRRISQTQAISAAAATRAPSVQVVELGAVDPLAESSPDRAREISSQANRKIEEGHKQNRTRVSIQRTVEETKGPDGTETKKQTSKFEFERISDGVKDQFEGLGSNVSRKVFGAVLIAAFKSGFDRLWN